MGDLSGDGGSSERPVHDVTMAAPFAVGKYEVTFAEWDACVAGGGCTHRPADGGWGRGTRPVIDVSWDDTQAYVRWLSRETGKSYRLLSEAEWEYVARAGSNDEIPWWGNEADRAHANYGKANAATGDGSRCGSLRVRHPVGSFCGRMPSVCSIRRVTCGNGWRIAGTRTIRGRRLMAASWTSGNCDAPRVARRFLVRHPEVHPLGRPRRGSTPVVRFYDHRVPCCQDAGLMLVSLSLYFLGGWGQSPQRKCLGQLT